MQRDLDRSNQNRHSLIFTQEVFVRTDIINCYAGSPPLDRIHNNFQQPNSPGAGVSVYVGCFRGVYANTPRRGVCLLVPAPLNLHYFPFLL